MTRQWRRRFGKGEPRLAYGDDAILRLPELVKGDGWGRVLLVCGRTSFEASGAARVLPDLEEIADVKRWSDFDPNTDSADLVKGLEVVRETSPDVIIGIGGGSAMDMAKLLCAYDTTESDDLLTEVRSGRRSEERHQALVLIPTTSGSGSEATHFAVVYIGDEKFSVAGPALKADAVILDPKLALSASPYQRATSGIDAVCQAIESLWAVGATPRSRQLADHSLRRLLPYIEQFVHEPSSYAARAMCVGSNLAGRAIDISKTTAAHALSYAITKRHGISHGHAVALTLGPLIEAHALATAHTIRDGIDVDEYRSLLRNITRKFDSDSGTEAHHNFAQLLTRIGLKNRLSQLGLGNCIAIKEIANSVNLERLENNPMVLEQTDLIALLESVA